MTKLTITLPYPPKELSPNARVHWRTLATAKRAAKEAAFLLTNMEIAWGARNVMLGETPNVRYTFHAPDQRRRDLDNAIASTKAYTDGIAAALHIDDSRFALSYRFGDVRPNGETVVEVTA